MSVFACIFSMKKQEKELEVGRLEEEKQVVQETLRKSADDVTEELVGAKSQILSLENQKEVCMFCFLKLI